MKKPVKKSIFAFVFFILAINVHADGWTASSPYHQTLYVDTLTSKTDASSVNIADSQGLFVTTDVKVLGNIGIGTLTPSQKLDVVGQIRSTGDICTDSGGGRCLGNISLANSIVSEWNSSGNNIFNANSGNVGIGTSNPSAKLEISGTANADIRLTRTPFGTVELKGGQSASGRAFKISLFGIEDAFFIADTTGNIGIGNTIPTEKLDVSGNVIASGTVCDSNGCIGSAGSSGWVDDGTVIRLTTSTDKVGINTDNPSSELEINGQLKITSSISDKIVLAGSQANPHTIYLENSKGIRFWDSANNELVRITNTGNVGIGINDPSYKLHVSGDIGFTGTLQAGTVPWAQISGAPAFITDGNTNWDNSYGYITDDTSVLKSHLANSGTLSFQWADSEVSDTLTASSVPWSGVSGKPTTIEGYGITDAITTGNIASQSVNYATTAGSANAVAWGNVVGFPASNGGSATCNAVPCTATVYCNAGTRVITAYSNPRALSCAVSCLPRPDCLGQTSCSESQAGGDGMAYVAISCAH